jgi:hypothetical protein
MHAEQSVAFAERLRASARVFARAVAESARLLARWREGHFERTPHLSVDPGHGERRKRPVGNDTERRPHGCVRRRLGERERLAFGVEREIELVPLGTFHARNEPEQTEHGAAQ